MFQLFALDCRLSHCQFPAPISAESWFQTRTMRAHSKGLLLAPSWLSMFERLRVPQLAGLRKSRSESEIARFA